MKVYVDADACPRPIKEILYKAAMRTNIDLILVANQFLAIPKHPAIQTKQVSQGFDVADNYIVTQVVANDLVITADIPLADEVISKGAVALNPRGECYTVDSIKQRLATRNIMDTLRTSGINTGGSKAFDKQSIQKFANALDRHLAKYRVN